MFRRCKGGLYAEIVVRRHILALKVIFVSLISKTSKLTLTMSQSTTYMVEVLALLERLHSLETMLQYQREVIEGLQTSLENETWLSRKKRRIR